MSSHGLVEQVFQLDVDVEGGVSREFERFLHLSALPVEPVAAELDPGVPELSPVERLGLPELIGRGPAFVVAV